MFQYRWFQASSIWWINKKKFPHFEVCSLYCRSAPGQARNICFQYQTVSFLLSSSPPLVFSLVFSSSPPLLLRASSVFSKQIMFLLPPSATIMAGFQSYDNFPELYHLKLSRIKSLALWNINDIRNERFNVMGKLLICTFYISLPLFLIYCNKLNWERRNSSTMERPAAPSV